MVVNSKKSAAEREHDLQPKRIGGGFLATTDIDHDNPIFPASRPRQDRRRPEPALVADITVILRDLNGVRLLAAILDAWYAA